MSAAQVDSKVAAAVSAMESEQWTVARARLLEAKALLAALPDRSTASGYSLTYDRGAIDALLNEIKQQSAAAAAATSTGPFGVSKVRYKRAEGCT